MDTEKPEPICIYCRKPIPIGEIALAFAPADPDKPSGKLDEKGPAHQDCQEAYGVTPDPS